MIKSLLLRLIRFFGYELAPRDGRATLRGVLANARKCGLIPDLVIDVGAGRGDFARTAAAVFPDASLLLVEPLCEFDVSLSQLCIDIPRAKRISAVASSSNGNISLNVHPDLFGSSLLQEDEDTDVNGVPRIIPSVTLDSQLSEKGSILLKVDVQGAELDVLIGASQVLQQSDLVILECSFFHFFRNGPLFSEVVNYMEQQGFVLYDLFGLAHRPLDGALSQVDAVFSKKAGQLRRHHYYATPAQRAALTKRLIG